MIDIGAYKEARITAKADMAFEILCIIDNDNLPEHVVIEKIEKLARKAKRKEDRYWRKMWKDVK